MNDTRINEAEVVCFCGCNDAIMIHVESTLLEEIEPELDALARDQGWHDHQTCGRCHEIQQRDYSAEFLRDMAREDSL